MRERTSSGDVLTGTRKPVQPRGIGAGGSLSQTPLMVGEVTCRYRHLGVIGNLGEGSLGNGSRGSEEAHCRQLFTGAFHGTRGSCSFTVVEVELRGPKDQIRNLTEKDVSVIVDFKNEALGGVIKVPKISFGSEFAAVGAISTTSITATLQTEVPDATNG